VNKQQRIAKAIKDVVSEMMDRVMERVLITDPFIKENHRSSKPLYAALVPDEVFKGSHFERRFVTPFGGVWEKLAQVVALEAHGNCQMGHTINGTIGQESLRRIQEVLNKLEHGKWAFPMRWFNMHEDESVLIGNEFWELIGGKGTYGNFIKEINILGNDYRERIYREFLGIEPPKDFEEGILK
jgi:Type II restriction endonuclease, TdeIII